MAKTKKEAARGPPQVWQPRRRLPYATLGRRAAAGGAEPEEVLPPGGAGIGHRRRRLLGMGDDRRQHRLLAAGAQLAELGLEAAGIFGDLGEAGADIGDA